MRYSRCCRDVGMRAFLITATGLDPGALRIRRLPVPSNTSLNGMWWASTSRNSSPDSTMTGRVRPFAAGLEPTLHAAKLTQHSRYWSAADAAVAALSRFLATPTRGLWHDWSVLGIHEA